MPIAQRDQSAKAIGSAQAAIGGAESSSSIAVAIIPLVARLRSRCTTVPILCLLWLLAACQAESTPESVGYTAPTPDPTSHRSVHALVLPTPTVTPPCSYGAQFIEDLTIPDGSTVTPDQVLDKRWAVRNTGSCDWGPDYRLVRVDPGAESGAAEMALYPARAGETAIWQVTLVAPGRPGDFLASWQARSPEGFLFGDQVFILINVVEADAAGG